MFQPFKKQNHKNIEKSSRIWENTTKIIPAWTPNSMERYDRCSQTQNESKICKLSPIHTHQTTPQRDTLPDIPRQNESTNLRTLTPTLEVRNPYSWSYLGKKSTLPIRVFAGNKNQRLNQNSCSTIYRIMNKQTYPQSLLFTIPPPNIITFCIAVPPISNNFAPEKFQPQIFFRHLKGGTFSFFKQTNV